MLKTNTKKAAGNIRNYILQDKDYIEEAYGLKIASEEDMLAAVWDIFRTEYAGSIEQNYHVAEYRLFKDWASGLALGNLFCYFYNRSAVQDLGDLLEESEAERNRYSEPEAEDMLTRLIYREVTKAAR